MKAKTLSFIISLALIGMTGCKGPSGGSEKPGHRGGFATGMIGTPRKLDPESSVALTKFTVKTPHTSETKVGTPYSAHFDLDSRDDYGPISVQAVTPSGQLQEKRVNWVTDGKKLALHAGANGLSSAVVGILSVPGWVGDSRNHIQMDLDDSKPKFNFGPDTTATPQPQLQAARADTAQSPQIIYVTTPPPAQAVVAPTPGPSGPVSISFNTRMSDVPTVTTTAPAVTQGQTASTGKRITLNIGQGQ